jgi:NAD(P)-dependent dehydrogenase (short-subunit alcohol dehydrogenase family)
MALRWKSAAPQRVFISGGGSGIGRESAKRPAAEDAGIAMRARVESCNLRRVMYGRV